MSYEGRTVHMCENGHICILCDDPYSDIYESEDSEDMNNKCEMCDTPFKLIGSIDDTNGEAVSGFKLEEVIPTKYEIYIDKNKGTRITVHTVGTYKVVNAPEGKCFNFDTGALYG